MKIESDVIGCGIIIIGLIFLLSCVVIDMIITYGQCGIVFCMPAYVYIIFAIILFALGILLVALNLCYNKGFVVIIKKNKSYEKIGKRKCEK
jgi:hypothetical protein